MKTAELFCGTKSFSKVAAEKGHQTFTLDNDPSFEADDTTDILTWDETPIKGVDLLWLSPPCQGFSVASIGRNWGGGFRAYEPKTDTARLAIALVKRSLEIIKNSGAKWWVM